MSRSKSKAGLAPFEAVPGFSGIYEARSKGLASFVIDLKSGGICLFSPVAGLTERARDSLLSLGDVRFLFAPNHYHNKAVREYAEAFPAARLAAPAAAIPRLEQVTGLEFDASDDLAAVLPAGAALLEPDGLKTGENWLRVRQKKNTAWMVVDAFCGPQASGPDEPQLLKTFPRYGVGDMDHYIAWVDRQVRRDKPTSLLPCHGRSIHDADLPEKLLSLVSDGL